MILLQPEYSLLPHAERGEAVAGWFDSTRSIWLYWRTGRYDLIWSAIRVPVAFLVAPLGAPLAIGLMLLPGLLESLPELLGSPEPLLENLELVLKHPLLIFLVAYSLSGAYLITLLVGIPLFLILRERKLTKFWIAPVVGGVVPLLLLLIFFDPLLVFSDPPPSSAIMLVALCGATVGTILWLVARPDRDVASSSGTPN